MKTSDIAHLNQRFGISGQATILEGAGGLPILTITNSHGTVELTPYGGHILSYQPAGQAPVLFLSQASNYTAGKAIRGGIPVCWPWFGSHPNDSAMPGHGFARLLFWNVEAVSPSANETEVLLSLRDDERTRQYWPHAFELTLRIVLGAQLRVELTSRNTGTEAFVLSQALHTYFSVADIEHVTITGLESTPFIDTLTHLTEAPEGKPIAIRSEVDRVYDNTSADCLIRDAELQREIRVAKEGSRSTVIWNPWIDKSKRMPDFGDKEFHEMLCIEATNIGGDVITLPLGSTHTLAQILSVRQLAE